MSASDNIKNTTAAALTALGIATSGVTPPPSASQLEDSRQSAQQRTELSRGDVTRHPTTSGS